MNILFFIYNLGIGGAETITTKYILNLKNKGVNVSVLVVEPSEDSFLTKTIKANDIDIYSIRKKSFFSKLLSRSNIYISHRWRKLLKKVKPDVVHLNSNTLFFPRWIINKTNVVFSFHTNVDRHINIFGDKEKNNLQLLANQGMAFFAISHIIIERIKTLFNTTNVYYVPNGIDIKKIRSESYSKEHLINEFKLPANSFIVGNVGRFNKVKNHLKTIEVFNEIHNKNPNSYLFLVGTGDEEEIARVDKYIEDNGIGKWVVKTGLRKDATSLMGGFDVLLLTSIIEGFPLVMVEAQSQGVRCITSTGIPEDVICTDNAFRLDLNESNESWASLALSNSKNKIHTNIEDYDMYVIIDNIISDYQEIIQKGKKNG